MHPIKRFLASCLTFSALLAVCASAASGASYHYCSPCYMPYQSEYEGATRHSYVLNYGHVVSAGSGWVGVRAHDSNHQSYGLNAQNWDESTHSYSGANLLFMIVNNIYDDGVGNGYAVNDNAHGNY